MRRCFSLGLVLLWGLLAPGLARAEDLLEEIWEAVHLDGVKVGSLHTTVTRPDGKPLRATADLELNFRRHGALLHLRVEQGTEETADGKVTGAFMRQHHPGGKQLLVVGTVEGNMLNVKVDEGRLERRARWYPDVVGLYGLEHFFEKRKPKAGERFTLHRYEPTYNTVLTLKVSVREPENVEISGARRSLTRVDMIPEKIVAPGQSIQPSGVVWWLDEAFVPVRRQIEMEGLGSLILTRTTRAGAASTSTTRLPDLGLRALIPLNRTIPRPYDTRSALYKVTFKDEPDPKSCLCSDAHQEVREVKGNTLELLVHPAQPRKRAEAPGPLARPGEEFLATCRFIDCADEKIQTLARRAVGDEKDPWRKAQRVERWVKANLRIDNALAFVPASQVAATLRGDCRSSALLTAALCRAEGIPARTAVGLLYVFKGRPQLGFHMWTEVWVEGQWLGLDGTLGRGGVSATHVKIADHSWQAVESLTPLLPVNRVLGKMSFEVLRVEAGE